MAELLLVDDVSFELKAGGAWLTRLENLELQTPAQIDERKRLTDEITELYGEAREVETDYDTTMVAYQDCLDALLNEYQYLNDNFDEIYHTHREGGRTWGTDATSEEAIRLLSDFEELANHFMNAREENQLVTATFNAEDYSLRGFETIKERLEELANLTSRLVSFQTALSPLVAKKDALADRVSQLDESSDYLEDLE